MMNPIRSLAFVFLAAACVTLASAGDFLNDLEAGKALAKKEDKALLVKFTGSDWCPPCQQLDQEVFSKSAFKKGVEKDFVVVVLDFPRTKELPAAEKEANEAALKTYQVAGFPTVLLMDDNGKPFKKIDYRGGGPESYLAMLKASLAARKFR